MRTPTIAVVLLAAALQACTSEAPPAPLQPDEWRVRWIDDVRDKPTRERPYARGFAVDHVGAHTSLELVVRNEKGLWGKPGRELLSEHVLHTFPLAERSDDAPPERLQLEVYVVKLDGTSDDQHDARFVWRRLDGGKAEGGSATFRRASKYAEGSAYGGPAWPLGDRRKPADEAVMLTQWNRGGPEPPGTRTDCTLEIRLR